MTDNMPSKVHPLDVGHWSPDLEMVAADMKGAPINVHKLMAHSPGLLRAWWDFRNYAVTGGSLGVHLGELIILRVGVHLGAWYEWGSHVDRALRVGITPDVIFQILNDQTNLPAPEALMLRAVDELMIGHGITPTTRAALEVHFCTAQLMDLIAIQGMYVILGKFIQTWDLMLDDVVAKRIETVTNKDDFMQAATAFQHEIRKINLTGQRP